MKISVILPVYNTEKFISHAIDSILSQEYKNFEIICIDDGSTDKSAQIIKEKAKNNPCIKYYFQKNQGPGIARRNGLNFASGELIYFMDSDDYLIDNLAFSKIVNIYDKYSPDIVLFNIKIINSKNECIISKPCNVKMLNKGYNEFEGILKQYIIINLYSKIFKRSLLTQDMFIDSNTFEDFYTTYLYLDKCINYYYLDEELYCCYHGEDNATHLSLTKNFEKEKKRLSIIYLTYSKVKKSFIKNCIADYCIQVIIAEITFRRKNFLNFKYMRNKKLLENEIKGIVKIVNESNIKYVPKGKFKLLRKFLFNTFLFIHK